MFAVDRRGAFAREMVDRRPFYLWKGIAARLAAVETEEDALKAAGALREVLNMEGLLLPTGAGRAGTPAADLPLARPMRVRGSPERIIRTTQQAALIVRELLTQRPKPEWEEVARRIEDACTPEEARALTETVRAMLETEQLLAPAE